MGDCSIRSQLTSSIISIGEATGSPSWAPQQPFYTLGQCALQTSWLECWYAQLTPISCALPVFALAMGFWFFMYMSFTSAWPAVFAFWPTSSHHIYIVAGNLLHVPFWRSSCNSKRICWLQTVASPWNPPSSRYQSCGHVCSPGRWIDLSVEWPVHNVLWYITSLPWCYQSLWNKESSIRMLLAWPQTFQLLVLLQSTNVWENKFWMFSVPFWERHANCSPFGNNI